MSHDDDHHPAAGHGDDHARLVVDIMNPGDVVYWRDKEGAKFGHLVSINDKEAVIQRMGEPRRSKAPARDVKPWPPPPPDEPVKKARRR
jgi:hypothetical protein